MRFPKPPKREAKVPKRIKRGKAPARHVRIKSVSAKRGQVVKADAVWAKKVRRRSPDNCEYCGFLFQFGGDPHHVWPKGDHPALRHVTANGIHLHRSCHDLAHSNMKAFRLWFAWAYPARWAALERTRLG